MTATIRVFVPTCRRPQLLPRALASLRAQTFADWVCDVHNDAPGDDAPGRLVASLGDPRIRLVDHATNLGGTATFNLFFQPTPEPFYTMLEDDNWWDPGFLAAMLAAAQARPDLTVFWANMRCWQEEADGTFADTGRTLWPEGAAGEPPRLFAWGDPAQLVGALHSNGAMLVRSRPGDDFRTPKIPFAIAEMSRERLFPYPIALVPQVLANYALTSKTTRSKDPSEWAELQVMFAATFLRGTEAGPAAVAAHWARARAARPPGTSTLLYASLVHPAGRPWRAPATLRDWLHLARGAVRRPRLAWRVLRSRRAHPDWWTWLEQHAARQTALARGRP